MPIIEYHCAGCNEVQEQFLHAVPDEAPACVACNGPRIRLASRFGIIFTGPLTARYNDPKRENAHQEGFWAYRKRSSVSGQEERIRIETHQELRDFCDAEGLVHPSELPRNATISADGRTISSKGMPGQWMEGMPGIPARLREIIDKPISEFSTGGASVSDNAAQAPHGGVTGGPAPIEQMDAIRPAEGMAP